MHALVLLLKARRKLESCVHTVIEMPANRPGELQCGRTSQNLLKSTSVNTSNKKFMGHIAHLSNISQH